MRRAAKTDTAQSGIVEAIEAEGWECFLIKLPCDLLCWHPVLDRLQWLEVKSARKKSGEHVKDKRQEAQIAFLDRTKCPVVTTPEEAIMALRKHYKANHMEGTVDLINDKSDSDLISGTETIVTDKGTDVLQPIKI